MAKQRPENPIPREFTREQLDLGIRKLDRRLSDLKALDPTKTSYNDPIVDRVESDIKATILDVFGPDSPEYSEQKYFMINQGPFSGNDSEHETQIHFQEGYPHAVEMISGLLNRLQEKREDLQPIRQQPALTSDPASSKKVFIVHGRDEELKGKVARFVEKLELEAIILSEKPSQGQTVIEKFEAHSDVKAAVIICSPDDIGCLRDEYQDNANNLKPRARQNAILELGYFVGKLGRKNVIPLRKGEIEMPSDIHGIVYVPYDESEGWKLKLAKELKAAGLSIDMNKIE